MNMLKKIYIYLLRPMAIVLTVAFLFGCSKHEKGSLEGSGMLTFFLSADAEGLGDSAATKSILPEFQPFLDTDLYLIEILEGEEETVVKTYPRYKDMPVEIELKSGNYKIRASYGELSPAAFEAPRFEGKSDFIIKEDMNTSLDVICSLANARLTISYSDGFMVTYPTHSAMFCTDFTGEDTLKFVQEEKRAAWFQVLAEGTDLDGILTVKDPHGVEQQFKVNVPSVKPQDDVKITFNSAPNEQSMVVKVTINEEVVEVPVYVYVPDYMLPVDGPVLETMGFAHGDPIVLARLDIVPELKVSMNVPGTIGNCLLSIWADNDAAVEYDLANLSAPEVIALSGLGLVVPDIFHKKKVELDFSSIIAKLPRIEEGVVQVKTYNYQLVVKDSLVNNNTSEPVILSVRMIPDVAPKITLSDEFISSFPVEIAEGGILFKNAAKVYPEYKAQIRATVDITEVTLRIKDAAGSIISSHDLMSGFAPSGVTYDASSKTVSYKESVKALIVEPGGVKRQEYELTVRTEYDGVSYEDVKTLTLDVIPPMFAMQMSDDNDVLEANRDVFAKRAVLRAFAQTCDASRVEFQVLKNGGWEDVNNLTQVDDSNSDMSFATATGLDILTQYTVRAKYGNHVSEGTTITTEGIGAPLPNAGFEDWSQTEVWETWHPGAKNIYVFYPFMGASNAYWSTNNAETTQQIGDASWYYAAYPCVVPTNATSNRPSYHRLGKPTTAKSGKTAMELSTVGWGKNNWGPAGGDGPDRTTKGSLFMGSYSLDSAPNEKLGREFNHRPTAVSFWYKFYSHNNESAKAYAIVYDKDRVEIARGELIVSGVTDTYSLGKFEIKYSIMEKAGHIAVAFLSSSSSSPGTANRGGDNGMFAGYGDSRHIGNVFTVDDVELIYE